MWIFHAGGRIEFYKWIENDEVQSRKEVSRFKRNCWKIKIERFQVLDDEIKPTKKASRRRNVLQT